MKRIRNNEITDNAPDHSENHTGQARTSYYEVWISSPKYHQDAPLTYSSSQQLPVGALVVVPLRRQTAVAVVIRKTPKPSFATKDIIRTVSATPLPEKLPQLITWMKEYYPAPFGQIMSLILPSSLKKRSREKSLQTPETPTPPSKLPHLTSEQEKTVSDIRAARPKPILVHGDTGTGKTRVYLELIKEMLAQGKSALLLTPEIGLTPQLALVCKATFPEQTVIVHSDLSPAVRRNTWLNILESSKPLVVIGARSALFSPLKDIGVIIIDEFHENTYKQEQAPHYLATRVAAKLATLHRAQLILGSATPPVSDYYTFIQKKLPLLRMREQALKQVQAKLDVTVTDLKQRDSFKRSPWLSEQLIKAIEEAHHGGKQSLLFLNRRGTARLVLCQTCGWQALCPHCDLTLTYHGDTHHMQCHTCGFGRKALSSCPECHSSEIVFRAIGTKSLVDELTRLFPDLVIKRFDSDTAKADRLERQYEAVKEGSADILVGTQMLGKGLDLPHLSVLGVVLADTSLSFPDYTAEERTFQLLTQVIGRVNRGHTAGSVFIQTYQPENPIIQAALRKDYEKFFESQLIERKLYRFPPFTFTLKLSCNYARQSSAQQASQKLADQLKRSQLKVEVVGPSPAFVEKTHGRYRWQVIVKSADRSELIKVIQQLPSNWSYDIDPTNLL